MYLVPYGEMAERSKAAVLKTVEVNSLLGFESLSLRQVITIRTLLFGLFFFLTKIQFTRNKRKISPFDIIFENWY